jgi:hypothetical protein
MTSGHRECQSASAGSISSPQKNFSCTCRKKNSVHEGIAGAGVRTTRTKSADPVHRFVERLDFPVLGYLIDTQNYLQAAAHGFKLWNVAEAAWTKICSGS